MHEPPTKKITLENAVQIPFRSNFEWLKVVMELTNQSIAVHCHIEPTTRSIWVDKEVAGRFISFCEDVCEWAFDFDPKYQQWFIMERNTFNNKILYKNIDSDGDFGV